MTVPTPSTRIGTRTVWTSPAGLRVEFETHGALRLLAHDDVVVNLFVANALEGGPANLVLRRHGEVTDSTLLLGPNAPTHWHADPAAGTLDGTGSWQGIDYRIAFRLAADAPAWFWHVQVENTGLAPVRVDLQVWQDIALAPYGAIRLNEYYVSQYIDHSPLSHPDRGTVLASRQNQTVGVRHPWCLIGSLNRGVGFATDALQVHGLAARAGLPAPCRVDGLPSTRLQHEHSMVALQDAVTELAPGASAALGWFGRLLPDHPAATSDDDLAIVDETLALPEARFLEGPFDNSIAIQATTPAATNLFSIAPALASTDLGEPELDALFGTEWRHVERDAEGCLFGFFHGEDAHVALRAKELAVLRPHGQVMRTGKSSVPDESALTSTVWMGGVFHSMLTQGHVSINRCLSTARSYLGLFRSQGLRVFVEVNGAWRLLDQPSAFEMRPDACRWVYRHADGLIEVTSTAHADPHAFGLEIETVEGPAMRCLVCLHVALDGDDGNVERPVTWSRESENVLVGAAPGTEMARRFPNGWLHLEPTGGTVVDRVGGDELLFVDGIARGLPYLALTTAAARMAGFRLRCSFVVDGPDVPAVDAPSAAQARLVMSAAQPGLVVSHHFEATDDGLVAARLGNVFDLMPWLAQNALVHYLAPRGLEQFSGGGWGTRDVCQGPVEYLMATGQHEAMREILLRVMRAQQPDGDWPQWFMFFERDAAIRAGDSHGDIVFWPLLTLGQYLIASGDAQLLDEPVAFYSAPDSGTATRTGQGAIPTVWQHALRALGLIRQRTIAGTALAAYGHGDWNDALQPADPAMRERMCSAWTVTLHHQMLTTLAQGLDFVGRAADSADLKQDAAAVRHDFRRLLLVDDVLTGYARFDPDPQQDTDGAAGQAATRITYLLHPRDTETGIRYSLLAMIHAILEGLFDASQMRHHLRLIDEHLSGPDGARLFDRPMTYRGGLQRHFQRAESASFFGREIGLMYMHAHLRYAQALAHVGEAARFFRALCQASPIGLQDLMPSAAPRPSNSYYSSSDAGFADRPQASAEYDRVRLGTIALKGGWRVYSSGAGILFGLVVRQLFGLRLEADALVIDPVLPPVFDGLQLNFVLNGRTFEIVYRVGQRGHGVEAVQLGGRSLPFTRDSNPYRNGAARVMRSELEPANHSEAMHRMVVHVGG